MAYNTTILYHTTTVRLKGSGTVRLGITTNTGSSRSTFLDITLTDTWTEYTLTGLMQSGDAGMRIVVITPTTQVATIYVDNWMVETGDTAHDWAYGGSSYTIDYVQHQGLMVEEATSNILTANQSTCGDTLGTTEGFDGTNATISVSSDYKKQGNKCIKVTFNGAGGTSGSEYLKILQVPTTSGLSYIVSGWVKAPLGFPFYIERTTHTVYTGTGDWQYISLSSTYTGNGTPVNWYIGSQTSMPGTIYVDMLQFEQKAYPTSWILGQTSRSAETMTIPSSVLNIDTNGYSNLLTANQSNVETDLTGFYKGSRGSYERDTSTYYEGTASLKLTGDGTATHTFGTDYITAVAGVTYSASVYAKTNSIGSGYRLYIYWYDSGNNQLSTVYTGFNTNSDFTEIKLENKTAPANTAKLKVLLVSPDIGVGENIWWDKAQLSATSTVKPWILGGTQSNTGAGTIEIEIFQPYPYIAPPSDRALVSLETTPSFPVTNRLYIRSHSVSGSIIVESYDSIGAGANLSDSTAFVYGWNKIAYTFDKDTLKLYINGILVTTVSTAVRLPNNFANSLLYLGSRGYSYTWANTSIRNVVISNIKRTDADIAARAADEEGFPVDQYVTGILPLQHDLEIFRAVTK